LNYLLVGASIGAKHVRLSVSVGSSRYLAVGAVMGNKAAGDRHGRGVGIAAGSCLTTARNWLNNLYKLFKISARVAERNVRERHLDTRFNKKLFSKNFQEQKNFENLSQIGLFQISFFGWFLLLEINK